jgi:hypothetical protein
MTLCNAMATTKKKGMLDVKVYSEQSCEVGSVSP